MSQGTVTPGRKVATQQEITQPGDWCLEQSEYDRARGVAGFYYRAPDATPNSGTERDHIFIRTGDKQPGYWQWDGDVNAPTLKPSIRHLSGSRWHGFFEAGNWRTL